MKTYPARLACVAAVFIAFASAIYGEGNNLTFVTTRVRQMGSNSYIDVPAGEVWRVWPNGCQYGLEPGQPGQVMVGNPLLVEGQGIRAQGGNGFFFIEVYSKTEMVPKAQMNAELEKVNKAMQDAKDAYLKAGAAIPISQLEALVDQNIRAKIVEPYEARIKSLEDEVAKLKAQVAAKP